MRRWIVVLLASSCFLACNNNPASPPDTTSNESPNLIVERLDTTLASHFIRQYISQMDGDTQLMVDSFPLFSRILIPQFYNNHDMIPVWIDSLNMHAALRLLKGSKEDGLLPRDYQLNAIERYYREVTTASAPHYEALAKLDLLITDGILLYAYHLFNGKLDPEEFNPTWNYGKRKIPEDVGKMLLQALQKRQVDSTILSLRPRHPYYAEMMKQLENYTTIKERGGWPTIDVTGRGRLKLEPGNTDPLVPAIRKRLAITGDLTDTAAIQNDDLVYSPLLMDAVKRFQSRHGLNTDGIVGMSTIKAMNVPVEVKIDKIRMSLERARWVLHELEDDFVLVNIPQFKLLYYRDGVKTWETRIIVGTRYTSTPVFSDNIKYIDFNPTWTVPYSITTKEILPIIKKDPGYLNSKNMQLLTPTGQVVDKDTVDFSSLSARQFPYVVRQAPGSHNALGHVKFVSPNPYSVYLHDTPNRSLFEGEERALSHGCIRTEQPLRLAEILLDDTAKWNVDTMKEIIATRRTTRINLPNPYPVVLQYWTHFTDENGTAHFFTDIYQRDEALLKGLNASVYYQSKVQTGK